MAITLKVSKDEFSCTTPAMSQQGHMPGFNNNKRIRSEHAPMPRPCSEKRVPPAKKHIPSTNTASISQIGRSGCTKPHLHRLLRIEPTTVEEEMSHRLKGT
jgi:hypothetical protein